MYKNNIQNNIFLFFADEKVLPEFPLIPASRGFCITLRKTLATFKEVLVKENIIQRPNEWQNDESAMELTNGIANQCQEKSKSVDNKIMESDESSGGNTQESKKKSTSASSNQSIKEATSAYATNSFTAAPSETKKSISSQNTS